MAGSLSRHKNAFNETSNVAARRTLVFRFPEGLNAHLCVATDAGFSFYHAACGWSEYLWQTGEFTVLDWLKHTGLSSLYGS